jgi:hypothetical protein
VKPGLRSSGSPDAVSDRRADHRGDNLAPMDMHGGQLNVPAETVRELVDAQFPAWRDLPVRKLSSSGTVNALFRVGEALVARLPLRLG